MYYLHYTADSPHALLVREIPPHTREHALYDGVGVAMFSDAGPFVATIDGIACYGSLTIGQRGPGNKILPLTRRQAADYEEKGLEERIRRRR